MRIASKINAALIGAFAAGTFGSFVVLETTIQPRFDEIELANAKANHGRVTEAFGALTEKLATATQDYAFWDQTYAFSQGEGTEEFITSNLLPEFKAVENLGVNALVFTGAEGKVIWGKAFDLESEEPIEGMVEELAAFSRDHEHEGAPPDTAERGLLKTSKGFILVAIANVLKSDRTGAPVGKVISAKLLDVGAVKDLTAVDFVLESLVHAAPEEAMVAGQSASSGPDQDAAPIEPDVLTLTERIETTSIVKDLLGEPLSLLKVRSPRDVSRVGAGAIRSAMLLMIIAAIAAIGLLWALLRHIVVFPVESLRTHFSTAGISGTIKPATVRNSKDEIGDLGNAFNAMADQVNHLRDQLADSAYLSGLSEWATGTLHNVRNGLMPVTTTAWQVEQLYDKDWLRNLEVAAQEHGNAATPAERRAKLNVFLVGSIKNLVLAAKQTSTLIGRINGASKSVLDMVSEFERYANRNTTIEAVDILPLIEAAATATVNIGPKRDTRLVLPKTTSLVHGNGVILRQVMSNILLNAVEAIEAAGRPGHITVTLDETPASGGMTRIAVEDDGEGIDPAHLADVFRRRVSTRHHRSGGLGLHWCANAIKVLGGTIHAESGGRGQGATIIIELPCHTAARKEAA